MTVSYNSDVSSVSSLNFLKLLCRWKGSIWKSVSSELLLWIAGYSATGVTYHQFLFPNGYSDWFNDIVYYCEKELHNYIPLTFMLAFFVSIIVQRWRTIFINMGWIESTALTLNAIIISNCAEARMMRRNIIRYLVLTQILVFRDISIRVRRRFPNIDSIKQAGFLTDQEEAMIDEVDLDYNKYWVPINWCITIINRANTKGYIVSAPGLISLQNEIKTFRTGLATLCNYDWCPIPIAYPQVVFFAVRIYFMACLITRQYIRVPNKDFEMSQLFLRPLITIIEFICIVGWMKVAEALLNPLGEDDDDFESNFLIDKNIFTGMRIVDNFDQSPDLTHDNFSDPGAMPIYSEESQRNYPGGALVGSVSNVELAPVNQNIHMVPVSPRLSAGDIYAHERPSVRRRFRSGNTSQAGSRAGSFREPKSPRQLPEEGGEHNDGLELDYELHEESSPTRAARFFSNLTKVDEYDEDSPATAKTSVVSRV